MKRRLSDHDEWAFDRLARIVSTNPLLEMLGRVWVRSGWGYASDSYRMLVLPVEMDGTGWVDRFDALGGGTVDFTADRAEYDLPGRVARFDLRPGMESAIIPESMPALRRWAGRRQAPTSGVDTGKIPATAVATDGSGALYDANGVIFACGGGVPFAVQAPYLASVALPLLEASVDGEVLLSAVSSSRAISVYCSDAADGWGLVMPTRVFWRAEWATDPKKASTK